MEYKVNSWKELTKLTDETEFELGDKIIFENCQVLVDEKPRTRVWQYVGADYYSDKNFKEIKYQPEPPEFIDINKEEE